MRLFCLLLFLHQGFSANFLGMKLPKEKWVGLGFYLAPYPGTDPLSYKHCTHEDRLLQISYARYQNNLLTVVAWKDKSLLLQDDKQVRIVCEPLGSGIFPELVFYKDFLEAKRFYLGKTVYLKKKGAYSRDAESKTQNYPLAKFAPLKVFQIDLAPPSENTSIRVKLQTQTGFLVHFDIGYTGINRIPKPLGLEHFCYMDHPKKIYSLSDNDWLLVQSGQTRTGMTTDMVELAVGSPENIEERPPNKIYYYTEKNRPVQYHFYRERLVERVNRTLDELPGTIHD